MKRIAGIGGGLLFVFLLASYSPSVLPWGHAGHQVVGAIADNLLSPAAKKKLREVARISLQSAAKWADCVKDVAAKDGGLQYLPDPRFRAACKEFEAADGIKFMVEYAALNWDGCAKSSNTEPCHKQFHYTDVAIQNGRYDRSFAGTGDADIVNAIKAAIVVLQGKPSPPPFGIRGPQEALLMLAHFMGDLHQPLHVGSVYIGGIGQLINPDEDGGKPAPQTETRGGNSIAVGTSNLHALWDAIPTSVKPGHISDSMLKEAKAIAKPSGTIASWPVTWASETVVVAQGAFQGIAFTVDPAKKNRWAAEFKDRKAYLTNKNKLQREQLAKAGARLAMVLNEVWK